MSTIELDKIRTDGGTQSRAAINDSVVADYAQTVRDGADLPPVTVFHDGKHYWLADGFHRLAAYRDAGATEIAAEVRQGTQRDAILFSVGANAAHGLRRTNDDKRRAVMTLLNDTEWASWSDREIARKCGVSQPMVSGLRTGLTENSISERTFTTKHGTVATMDTARIGKRERATPPEAPGAEQEAFDLYSVAKPSAREQQAENDASREQARAALPDHIKRIEEAKARSGSHHAAVVGRPAPKLSPAEIDAIVAERDELREENAALKDDVARLTAQITKFDEMVAQYERGGFEAIIATKDQRIQGLLREVEDVTADRASLARSRDHWRKTAIDLGYISPNSRTIEIVPDDVPQYDISEDVGF